VLLCTFGGALFGMWLRTVLPEHHLDAESRDVVKVGIGLIATMTALVLGLVTASAKHSFDAMDAAVKTTAIEVLTLDRLLARYGAETGTLRQGLQRGLGARIDVIWPPGAATPATFDPLRAGVGAQTEGLADAIRALTPRDDAQRALQARALDLTEALLQARWLVLAGTEASVPVPFLVILVFWLTITFASFGLLAPRNATVLGVLLVCALSVGSAVFLILEMDGPFDGLLRVSADPLRYAVAHLNE
jgi:Protein of unknown function (DUF4239)